MPLQRSNTANLQLTPLKFKKILRLKITAILISVSVISMAILITSTLPIPQKIIFISAFILFGTWMIWKLLSPLQHLYEGIKVIAKGELAHRFNIDSNDEIGQIAEVLNQASQNFNSANNQISSSRSQLESEKNKLSTIISSITDGVIVLDLHHQVALANQAAEKVSGYPILELVGQPIDQLISFKDQTGKIITCNDYCQEFLTNTVPNLSKHFPSLTLFGKNQQQTRVEMTSTSITEGIQADLGCILILYDVTQRKLFEQMQIDFVSMASHEIRTPLTSIISYLQTISEESGNKLDQELKGFLDRALYSAKQLAALINNLLNVSKVERGSFSISLQPLDWNRLLTRIVEDNQALAVSKNLSLRLTFPPNPLPQVLADEIRISEVLNNLISNAVNYSKKEGHIEIATKLQGKEVITKISDDGIGIPKEGIPYLFTKFFRVAGSLEQMKQGTGLGLYISKSIIDLHHGKIWVESELGKGTTFYFSLPIAEAASTHPTIADLLKH